MHLEKGGDMQSFSVQIDFTHWHKCQCLDTTNIWDTGFLVPQVLDLSPGQSRSEKDFFAFATVHFFTNYLVSQSFSKYNTSDHSASNFPSFCGIDCKAFESKMSPRLFCQWFQEFPIHLHRYCLPVLRDGQLWGQKINSFSVISLLCAKTEVIYMSDIPSYDWAYDPFLS